MTVDPQHDYLTTRWQTQRDYYSRQSTRNKRWSQWLQLLIALGAVTVPVLLGIPEVPKLIPTLVSVLVAIAAAVENVYHFGDTWRNYRQTLEALKRERALFDARVGVYAELQTAFATFVERCEGIIAQETGSYFDVRKEQARPQLPPEVK